MSAIGAPGLDEEQKRFAWIGAVAARVGYSCQAIRMEVERHRCRLEADALVRTSGADTVALNDERSAAQRRS